MRTWTITIKEKYIEDEHLSGFEWAWLVETIDDEGYSVKIAGRTSQDSKQAAVQARNAINRWVETHRANPKTCTFTVETE